MSATLKYENHIARAINRFIDDLGIYDQEPDLERNDLVSIEIGPDALVVTRLAGNAIPLRDNAGLGKTKLVTRYHYKFNEAGSGAA